MFKKFYAKRAMIPAPDHAHVKDRYTDKVIYTGTVDACQRYVDAFGRCYVEAF